MYVVKNFLRRISFFFQITCRESKVELLHFKLVVRNEEADVSEHQLLIELALSAYTVNVL